jgi:hypothetical protein
VMEIDIANALVQHSSRLYPAASNGEMLRTPLHRSGKLSQSIKEGEGHTAGRAGTIQFFAGRYGRPERATIRNSALHLHLHIELTSPQLAAL